MSIGILLVDDDVTFRALAEEVLAAEGFEVKSVSNLRGAKEQWRSFGPDVIILDRRLPDGDGIEFLKAIRAFGGDEPIVVVVTAYGDIENAVEALRAGAWDYLAKPIHLSDLVIKLQKVIETRGLKDRLTIARSQATPARTQPLSKAMQEVLEKLDVVAISPLTPVFIQGSSGVGKQYAAELLHRLTYQQKDIDAPFVEVNCAALPEHLIESELFGYEKGAFTDAKAPKRGLIELASGGTLFLDEITELPLRSQAKLLKFIDSMRFRRLGGQREISVNMRVVAATNTDVMEAVRTGRFREDLYHRLGVYWVGIPALTERKEDIPGLALSFMTFFANRIKRQVEGFSQKAMEVLQSYHYPGNVRELRNLVERAVILCTGPVIEEKDLAIHGATMPSLPVASPVDKVQSSESQPSGNSPEALAFFNELSFQEDPPTLAQLQRAYVAQVLQHFDGKRMQAAQALGVSYPTFLKLLREAGLDD